MFAADTDADARRLLQRLLLELGLPADPGRRSPQQSESCAKVKDLLRVSICERRFGWRLASAWRMACQR
jgi:hypothetical protein